MSRMADYVLTSITSSWPPIGSSRYTRKPYGFIYYKTLSNYLLASCTIPYYRICGSKMTSDSFLSSFLVASNSCITLEDSQGSYLLFENNYNPVVLKNWMWPEFRANMSQPNAAWRLAWLLPWYHISIIIYQSFLRHFFFIGWTDG